MHQKRCRSDKVIERRVVLIVTIAHSQMAAACRRRQTGRGFRAQRLGSSCDWAAFPLFETLVDAQSLVGVRHRAVQRLDAHQPGALQKIDQQQRGCGKLRCAETLGMKKPPQHMAQQSGTECFTMSGTMMDNKPLPPSSAEPDPPQAADDKSVVWGRAPSPVQTERSSAVASGQTGAGAATPASPTTTGAQRKSPLRDLFVGPDGIYADPRWLIYLAIAFVVFQMEVWLLASLRPYLSDLLWRMMIEASMMLAAILPGFVMARIEN